MFIVATGVCLLQISSCFLNTLAPVIALGESLATLFVFQNARL